MKERQNKRILWNKSRSTLIPKMKYQDWGGNCFPLSDFCHSSFFKLLWCKEIGTDNENQYTITRIRCSSSRITWQFRDEIKMMKTVADKEKKTPRDNESTGPEVTQLTDSCIHHEVGLVSLLKETKCRSLSSGEASFSWERERERFKGSNKYLSPFYSFSLPVISVLMICVEGEEEVSWVFHFLAVITHCYSDDRNASFFLVCRHQLLSRSVSCLLFLFLSLSLEMLSVCISQSDDPLDLLSPQGSSLKKWQQTFLAIACSLFSFQDDNNERSAFKVTESWTHFFMPLHASVFSSNRLLHLRFSLSLNIYDLTVSSEVVNKFISFVILASEGEASH